MRAVIMGFACAVGGACFGAPADDEADSSSAQATTEANATDGESLTGTVDSTTGGAASSTETTASGDTGAESTQGTTTDSSETSGDTGAPIDPDLVGWYRFDEVNVPTIVDSSPFGHDGMCDAATCPGLVPGIIGGAGAFDSNDDLVVIPHQPEHVLEDSITVAIWMRPTQMPTINVVGFAKGLGNGIANAWQLNLTSAARPMFVFASDVEQVSFVANNALSLGEWAHVALTWDGTTVELWVNGESVGGTEVGSTLVDDRPLTIGGDIDNGVPGNHFGGQLDDARIYRRALSPTEIGGLAGSRR